MAYLPEYFRTARPVSVIRTTPPPSSYGSRSANSAGIPSMIGQHIFVQFRHPSPMSGLRWISAKATRMRSFVVKIGRAHVCTPVTTAHLVCRLLLEKKQQHNKHTYILI